MLIKEIEGLACKTNVKEITLFIKGYDNIERKLCDMWDYFERVEIVFHLENRILMSISAWMSEWSKQIILKKNWNDFKNTGS